MVKISKSWAMMSLETLRDTSPVPEAANNLYEDVRDYIEQLEKDKAILEFVIENYGK